MVGPHSNRNLPKSRLSTLFTELPSTLFYYPLLFDLISNNIIIYVRTCADFIESFKFTRKLRSLPIFAIQSIIRFYYYYFTLIRLIINNIVFSLTSITVLMLFFYRHDLSFICIIFNLLIIPKILNCIYSNHTILF